MKRRSDSTVRALSRPVAGKAISQKRDRIQSQALAGTVGILLAAKLVLEIMLLRQPLPIWFWWACAISVGFATVVFLLRSATGPAAAMGGIICMNVLMRQEIGVDWKDTAMPALLALFVLTFAATRFGRARKELLGVAEGRKGRRASQVIANLGAAGLLAAGGTGGSKTSALLLAACIAALAEATADTVSSEMGQALAGSRWAGSPWAGPTVMITTGRPVAPGTDGGVSLAGTVLGMASATVIVLLSPFARSPRHAICLFAAAWAGLIFDSVLGATVEKKGWLGNDLVNFTSTLFAAAATWMATALIY